VWASLALAVSFWQAVKASMAVAPQKLETFLEEFFVMMELELWYWEE